MTAQFVDDQVTPVSLPDLALALFSGHRLVMADSFTGPESMASAFAQLCLESGNGQKNHHFNFHNEKLSSEWAGLYTAYQCDEILDSDAAAVARMKGHCSVWPWKGGPLQRVVLFEDHPWARFVAFSSATEGAARYIEFLSCRERYAKAWHALRCGDTAEFSRQLKAAGYYTADELSYTSGLVSIAHRSLPLCEQILTEQTAAISDEDVASIQSLVASTISETVIWMPDRHQESSA